MRASIHIIIIGHFCIGERKPDGVARSLCVPTIRAREVFNSQMPWYHSRHSGTNASFASSRFFIAFDATIYDYARPLNSPRSPRRTTCRLDRQQRGERRMRLRTSECRSSTDRNSTLQGGRTLGAQFQLDSSFHWNVHYPMKFLTADEPRVTSVPRGRDAWRDREGINWDEDETLIILATIGICSAVRTKWKTLCNLFVWRLSESSQLWRHLQRCDLDDRQGWIDYPSGCSERFIRRLLEDRKGFWWYSESNYRNLTD